MAVSFQCMTKSTKNKKKKKEREREKNSLWNRSSTNTLPPPQQCSSILLLYNQNAINSWAK